VGNDQQRAVARDVGEIVLDNCLAFRVERTRRLVEDQETGPDQQGASDRQTLALSAGEIGAVLLDKSIVRYRQPIDELVSTCDACRFHDLVERRAWSCRGDVVTHSTSEHEIFLEHDADVAAQRGDLAAADGVLAALAVLRRPDVFHAAVSGAPVTDWHLYDTHYTERYLGHPDQRPEVYAANSLFPEAGPGAWAWAEPHRPMLIIHGLADDNVFVAHSLRLSSALLAAGFSRVYIFRPAYIYPVQPRKEPNFGYRLLRAIYPAFRVLFPNQVIRADDLARAMVEVAVQGTKEARQCVVFENRDIQAMVEAFDGLSGDPAGRAAHCGR